VSVNEALKKQADEGYTYVDVRTIQEFEGGHPVGAVNIPLLHPSDWTGMVPNEEFLEVIRAHFPQDAKLLLGCEAGVRSRRATEMLLAVGYRDVLNVAGGFGGARDMFGRMSAPGWRSQGLPVEDVTPPGAGYEELRRKRQA
jgi:rhodanese-related sulfurtransferase